MPTATVRAATTDEIEKTLICNLDPGPNGEKAGEVREQLAGFAKLGFSAAVGSIPNVASITPLEIIGREIIPAVAEL